jgi:phage major head subunit gpT-like protein
MANRSNFGDVLEPGFREIFDDKYSEVPMVMESIYNVNSSTAQDEKDSAVSGFGYLDETDEREGIRYEDPIQMYNVTYQHKKYTKGFKITRELYEDDQYNVMKKKPAALGRAARRTAEYLAAGTLNNAFSTSYVGGDAKPLCSVSHPRADAGTAQSNANASGITLTEPHLETGRLAMRKVLDDKGMKIDSNADTLVVPIDLEKTAHLIVDSSLRQGTADNDANFYKGSLKIISWIYLTSTTAWFLVDSKLKELNWFWRIKPEFKQDDAFDTDEALFKTRMRLSKGFSDWRGVWGSAGDGANYTS